MKKLTPALILIGISSITAQIVIIRELLILFYGNELSIGIILANWLFWTGVGSWLGGKVSRRIKEPVIILSLTEIILSFLLIVTILSVRGIVLIIPSSPGEMLGIVPIWLYSFILLCGICFTNGFLFVVGCRAIKSIGTAYILESIGAGFGGLVCSIVLIKYLNSFYIIWLLVLANLFTAGLLWRKIRYIIYGSLVFTLILGLLGIIDIIHQESRRWQWRKYAVLSSRDSIYGNITVTRHDSIYNFYESGLLAFSVPDKLSSEETAHLNLLQHPEPKKILLIGGGLGGVIDECLKYQGIESIDYVELDPLLIKLADEFLPGIDSEKVSHVRNKAPMAPALPEARISNVVRIYNIDGIRFLKTTNNIYDVIIVNLPDPKTAQINRYYTLEFFKLAKEHLAQNGVLALGATSGENYIAPSLGEYLRCIYFTLKNVFPEVKVLPGEYARFIAGRNIGYITDDYKVLEKRLRVDTQYVRDYYLKYKFSPERLNYLYEQLSLERPKFLNRDFHPISYYYNITFWSTYFNVTFKKIFQFMAKMKLWHFCILLFLAIIWPRIKTERYVLFPIMTSGFSEISFQIVTILAFQVLYGYLYYKLGLIITSFMIGLALGSYYINRIISPSPPPLPDEGRAGVREDYSLFLKTQIAMIIYPLLLPIIFYIFARFGSVLGGLGENIIFPYLPIIAGFIGGFQFPLGSKIYLRKRKEIGYTAGVTYGIDLFGACIGVLLISAFILPVLGITKTCLVTAIVNLGALIVILRAVRNM